MSFRLPPFSVADVIGLSTTALAVWFSLPQLLRVARTRAVGGLSATGLANSAVSLAGWTVYGAAHGFWWVVASSLAGMPATLATLVLASRLGARTRPLLPLLWAGVLLVAAAGAVLVDPVVLDVVLGCSILWFVAPAAVQAWRSDDVSGISPQSWLVLAVEASLFAVYGVVADVGADRVYGVAGVAGAAVVLARLCAQGTVAPAARDDRRQDSDRDLSDTGWLEPVAA